MMMVSGWFVAVLLAAPVADDTSPARVWLTMPNTTLGAAAAVLAAEMNVPVRVAPNLAHTPVSLQAAGLPPEGLLELLAESLGVQLTRTRAGWAFSGGAATPVAATRPALDRTLLRKVILNPQHVKPSRLAAYFGRYAVASGETGDPIGPPELVTVTTPGDGLESTLAARRQQRWSNGGGLLLCRSFTELPTGMLAMLGYDPDNVVVIVGEPPIAELMAGIVGRLDRPVRPMRVELRPLPAAAADGTVQPSLNRKAEVVWRSADPAPDGGGEARIESGQPVVLGLQKVLRRDRWDEDCSIGLSRPQQAGAVAIGCDLRLTAWAPVGNGDPVLLTVAPAYVDVITRAGETQAALEQTLPCLATMLTVPAGQWLALDAMRDGAAELPTCPYLAELPLVGPLFGAGRATGGVAVRVTLLD